MGSMGYTKKKQHTFNNGISEEQMRSPNIHIQDKSVQHIYSIIRIENDLASV